ncbi:MAG: DHA2 family efflux MFS transporter permease subunit [Chromatiales bacterium]|jgi:MFS transporter, DHA2 family, multidrug resistance protein|nr:DHA2 family efflux MFS transporter permease subunit [Chromatiales bacterium]
MQTTFSPLETWLATLAGLTAFFTALFTASMVNVAIPSVMGSFGVGQSQAQLLLSTFLAMNSTGLLASSWAVARYGQREVFLGALLIFGLAGLLCFIAPNFDLLVLARVTQGFAAGLLQPLVMMVLVQVFPSEKRGLAMAMFAMGVTAAVGIGPAVGGVIIDAFQWRLIFLAPIPLALLALVLGFFFLPAVPRQMRPPGFDWLGFALVNGIVFLWFMILGNGQRWGWSSDIILTFMAAVTVGLLVFYWSQRRPGPTLIDLTLFRSRTYVAGLVIIFFFGFGTLATVYAFPIFGQIVQNLPAVTAGALLLPASIFAAALMPFTGKATDIFPHRALLSVGLFISAGSIFLLADADANTHFWYVAFVLLLTRIGSAVVTPPMMTAPLLGLPMAQMQRGAGLTNFAVIFGGSNGIGFYALLLELRIESHARYLGWTQTFDNDGAREFLHGIGALLAVSGLAGVERDGMAIGHLRQVVIAQANTLGFQDGFVFIGISLLFSFIPLLWLRSVAQRA